MPADTIVALEDVWRREAPHVLAALLRRGAALEDCEDAAQEALLAASTQWPSGGTPTNPRGWLVTVASRRLVDGQRSDSARARRELAHGKAAELDRPARWADRAADHDDTLQLLMLCAHPALTPASAVALTLRSVAGLTTRQIAAALLIPEATAAQRISRAKAALRKEGTRFGTVESADLPRRLHSVRHVLHLVFTAGSTQDTGERVVDVDLTAEALRLTEQLHQALPQDTETTGLLALMLLVDARTPSRMVAGDLVPLADQDRSKWKLAAIERAVCILEECLPRGIIGPFQLQAAIAAVHDTAPTFPDTNWPEILALYRMLQRVAPSAAVDLGTAIALAEVDGPAAGLAALAPLAAARPRDHRITAAQAHLLDRLNDPAAPAFYHRAAALTDSSPEQRYLHSRGHKANPRTL